MKRRFECKVCSKKFKTTDGQTDHEKYVHGIEPPRIPIRMSIPDVEPKCIECGEMGLLVSGSMVYPHRPDLYGLNFYRCPCGAFVGCHPKGMRPLGYPAGPETRKARTQAHKIFDQLWRNGFMQRRDAYRWLANKMNMEYDDCHFGMMTKEQAEKAIYIVELCSVVPEPIENYSLT